jgi:hypothetical protein
MPGQFRGRPNIDPDSVKATPPPPAHIPGPPPVQNEEKKAPVMRERPEVIEHPVMPGQFRGRPNIDPDGVKATPPPPAHIPGPPPVQNEEKKAPVMRERPEILEHPVMPGQFRGRPNVDPDSVKAPPPPPPKPQIAPPPPAPAPVMHERPHVPERPVMPNQFRGRPNIDPDGVKAAPPPPPKPQIAPPLVQQRPQHIAPPPQAAPPQGQPGHLDPEALKRLKKQQEADKKD